MKQFYVSDSTVYALAEQSSSLHLDFSARGETSTRHICRALSFSAWHCLSQTWGALNAAINTIVVATNETNVISWCHNNFSSFMKEEIVLSGIERMAHALRCHLFVISILYIPNCTILLKIFIQSSSQTVSFCSNFKISVI